MPESEQWYIVKQETGQCEIVAHKPNSDAAPPEMWGPFTSKSDAIARRVGLIRAGKCRPA